jgi:anti-sigma regulatory factor (Ser/Thr protein kinase)
VDVPYIELSFKPNAALVSTVRRFVSEYYNTIVGDSEAISRVALATHELLENAVKYASDGETKLRIEIDVTKNPRSVVIQMRNRALPAHREAVRQIVDDIAAAADPLTFYHQLIVTTLSRDGSGLGLARICAEAEMTLACAINDDVVALTGVAEICVAESESAA